MNAQFIDHFIDQLLVRRFSIASRISPLFWAFGLTAAALFATATGCRTHAPSEAIASGRSSRVAAPESGASVANSPTYRLAVADFKHRDFTGAEAYLKALLKTPGLTDTDRTFLLHQQEICRTAISGKPLAAQIPSAPARHVVRLTAAEAAAQADCGPRALLLACEAMHVTASLDGLRKAAGTTGEGTNLAGLIYAAQTVGIQAEGVQMDGAALANLDTDKAPALAWVDGNHYVTVLQVHGDRATIHDPNKVSDDDIPLTSGPTGLLARSGGILLRLSRGSAHKLAKVTVNTAPRR